MGNTSATSGGAGSGGAENEPILRDEETRRGGVAFSGGAEEAIAINADAAVFRTLKRDSEGRRGFGVFSVDCIVFARRREDVVSLVQKKWTKELRLRHRQMANNATTSASSTSLPPSSAKAAPEGGVESKEFSQLPPLPSWLSPLPQPATEGISVFVCKASPVAQTVVDNLRNVYKRQLASQPIYVEDLSSEWSRVPRPHHVIDLFLTNLRLHCVLEIRVDVIVVIGCTNVEAEILEAGFATSKTKLLCVPVEVVDDLDKRDSNSRMMYNRILITIRAVHKESSQTVWFPTRRALRRAADGTTARHSALPGERGPSHGAPAESHRGSTRDHLSNHEAPCAGLGTPTGRRETLERAQPAVRKAVKGPRVARQQRCPGGRAVESPVPRLLERARAARMAGGFSRTEDESGRDMGGRGAAVCLLFADVNWRVSLVFLVLTRSYLATPTIKVEGEFGTDAVRHRYLPGICCKSGRLATLKQDVRERTRIERCQKCIM
eukprot:g10649.t1